MSSGRLAHVAGALCILPGGTTDCCGTFPHFSMAAASEPAAVPRHSMHGKMFTHVRCSEWQYSAHVEQMYSECLKSINEIQYCKRTRGPAHPECVILWDELFLCYTEANCPTRFAKADKCIKGPSALFRRVSFSLLQIPAERTAPLNSLTSACVRGTFGRSSAATRWRR